MSSRPAFLAVLLFAAAPALGQSMPAYDDQRAGYVQRDDREIGSVLEFEAPLARYGSWVPSRFGRAWHPRVSPDWRPYTVGRWVDGPDGAAWQSDEPWGWATYHYGRWGFDDRWGWVWVPATEWAPAWVAWRDGDQYSGWAPLPPQAGYDYDVDAWDYTQWYAPSWIYVPRASLYRRNVGSVALPWRSGRSYWNVTRGARRDDFGRGVYRGRGDQGANYRARGVGGQDGYGRAPGRPDHNGGPPTGVRPGQPPVAGGYGARPQDGPGRTRPDRGQGAAQLRPDQPDRQFGGVRSDRDPAARADRDRAPGFGQGTPRPDRRPGYVPLGDNPGQRQPWTNPGRPDRPGSSQGDRGGRGGAVVAPGSGSPPVLVQQRRPPPPPAAAPAPQQARPGPPPGPPQQPRQANPRLGREGLRKPD